MSVLPYLEIFTAVVETGSFTAAADTLQISKPVVSKKITRLEQILAVQLFRRTTRKIYLTEAGEIFLQYTRDILERAQEAEKSILPLQTDPHGVLRITAPESLAVSILPDALGEYLGRCPNLELDVTVSGQIVDLLDTGIDVALRVGKLADSSLIARGLMPCRFLVCASPAYWKKHGKPEHPTELKQLNCLIYTQSAIGDSWRYSDNGTEMSVKVSGNFRTSSGQLMLNAAISDQGVFLAPSFMVEQAISQGTLVSVLEDYALPDVKLYAVYPYSRFVPPKVRSFIDFLSQKWASV